MSNQQQSGVQATDAQIDDLQKRLERTAGSRFNAHRRLEARDRSLTRLTAFTSAYVIVLTVLPYFRSLSVEVTDWLNLLSVACTLIILISSLLQYSRNDVVNAEQHHRSGLEVNELRRRLNLEPKPMTIASLRLIDEAYGQVLQKYSVNHDDIDYDRYRLSQTALRAKLPRSRIAWIYLQLGGTKYIPSLTLIVVSIAVGATIAALVLPPPQLTSTVLPVDASASATK